jgi:hypothetical protein
MRHHQSAVVATWQLPIHQTVMWTACMFVMCIHWHSQPQCCDEISIWSDRLSFRFAASMCSIQILQTASQAGIAVHLQLTE